MKNIFFKKKAFKSCLIILLVIAANYLSGQQDNYDRNLGYFSGKEMLPINGYFDIGFTSKKKTECEITFSKHFIPGYYFDKDHYKVKGRIKFVPTKNYFKFRTDADKTEQKIKAEECTEFIVGKDKFTVISGLNIERSWGTQTYNNPEFILYLTKVNDLEFFMHFSSTGRKFNIDYLVRNTANGIIEHIPESKNKFKKVALKYFGKIPGMSIAINEREVKEKDIPEMIKCLSYYYRYTHNEKVYFNQYWEELPDSAGFYYYATINDFKNKKRELTFYTKDSGLLHSGSYSKLAFLEKDGGFTFFYPNGKIRKHSTYKKNKIIDMVSEYFQEGGIHYQYRVKKDVYPVYLSVKDQTGKEKLDEHGNGTETIFDSVYKREINREFRGNTLENAWYLSPSGHKVYQLCNKCGINNTVNLNDNYQDLEYPLSSAANDIQGTVLMRILIDENGQTVSANIIKGLDKKCNDYMQEYCNTIFKGEVWMPLKINKQPVQQEMLMTYVFKINGFDFYRNNFNYGSIMLMNQNMMQQQMFINSLPAVAPH